MKLFSRNNSAATCLSSSIPNQRRLVTTMLSGVVRRNGGMLSCTAPLFFRHNPVNRDAANPSKEASTSFVNTTATASDETTKPPPPPKQKSRKRYAEDGFVEEEEDPAIEYNADAEALASEEPTFTATASALLNKKDKHRVPEGEILSFVDKVLSMTANAGDAKYNSTPVHKRFDKKDMRFVGEHENVVLEVQRLQARYQQQGPFLGSTAKDVMVSEVDSRSRRAMDRVPQMDAPYVANETSFRRLPKHFKMPAEGELTAMYPRKTNFELVYDEAYVADNDGHDIDNEAPPIRFWKVLPPNYDENKVYPYMVVLPDGGGIRDDFEDICANFFERPAFRPGLIEQEWVLVSPEFAVKNSWSVPQEAVIARFCDYIVANFKVEHGRVHLFGKGYGANAAIRTCIEQKNVAISCTAILGRPSAMFKQIGGSIQQKIQNLQGIHTLMYVPGRMQKTEWAYKMKFMMDDAKIRPPMRAIHFADVSDHQVYFCINPDEFWNHMRYFRQYNNRMLSEDTELAEEFYGTHPAAVARRNDLYEPAFSSAISENDVKEAGMAPEEDSPIDRDRKFSKKEGEVGVGGVYSDIDVETVDGTTEASAGLNDGRTRRKKGDYSNV